MGKKWQPFLATFKVLPYASYKWVPEEAAIFWWQRNLWNLLSGYFGKQRSVGSDTSRTSGAHRPSWITRKNRSHRWFVTSYSLRSNISQNVKNWYIYLIWNHMRDGRNGLDTEMPGKHYKKLSFKCILLSCLFNK